MKAFSKMHRIIAMLLALILTVSVGFWQMVIVKADNIENSGDYVLKEFSNGTGTLSDPYQISSAEELAYLVNQIKVIGWKASCFDGNYLQPKYYELTADIELNNVSDKDWKSKNPKEWIYGTSEETEKTSFVGRLNGNGHIIKGLYINKDGSVFNGLFSGVMGNGEIKNLGIENSYIGSSTEENYCGAIFGAQHIWPYDASFKISSCYVEKNVSVEGKLVGGIGGRVTSYTEINNSYSYAKLKGEWAEGNLIGETDISATSTVIKNCYNPQNNIKTIGSAFSNSVIKYSYSYSVWESYQDLAKVSLDKMMGKNAKTNLNILDFKNIWATKDNSTPVLKIFGDYTEEEVDYEVWDGTVSSGLVLRDTSKPNSKDNPYIIKNGADLAYLVNSTNTTDKQTENKFYEITEDIYLNKVTVGWENNNPNEWVYGTRNDTNVYNSTQFGAFYGNLNGNGHIIYGLYIKENAKQVSGLFVALGEGAQISKLGIEKSVITAKGGSYSYAGALFGYIGRTGTATPEKIVISNCYSSDTVTVSGEYTGGITGLVLTTNAAKLEMNNCYSSAALGGTKKYGGMIADIWENSNPVKISHCYNSQNGISLIMDMGNGCINYNGCYTTGTADTGITQLTSDKMNGSASVVYMSGLFEQDDTWYKTNTTPALTAFRRENADSQAPEFSGKIKMLDASKNAVGISWPLAKDELTPAEFLLYKVYYSETPINEDNISDAVFFGEYVAVNEVYVSGLCTNEKYYFAVEATDPYENKALLTSDAFSTQIKVNAVWNGSVDIGFDSGDGSKENPYQIATAEQLAYLVKLSNEYGKSATYGKYYVLTSDIYLNDVSKEEWYKENPREWIFGSALYASNGFAGNLDGQYHVVNGIYINNDKTEYNGLFPLLDDGVNIKNLGVANSYLLAPNGYAAPLAAYKINNAQLDTEIKECFADDTVIVSADYAGGLLGGIAYPIVSGNFTVTDCYSGADISGVTHAGGIVGDIWEDVNLTLVRCYSTQRNVPIISNWNYKAEYVNSYSPIALNSNPDGTAAGQGLTVLKNNIFSLTGEKAKAKLTAFDFENVWQTVDFGTPYLKGFKTNRYTIVNSVVTVSFETNGGEKLKSIKGLVGSEMELPTPVYEGNEFKGWYVFSELDVKYPIDAFPGYDLTLYAKWEDSAVVRQDFESYSFDTEGFGGLGYGYENYRPGVDGYDSVNVHTGMKAIHRIHQSDYSNPQDFTVFNYDSDTLESGKNYKISFWVKKSDNTDATISLVATDSIDVNDEIKGLQEIIETKKLIKGKWQRITVEFTAVSKYVSLRTSTNADLYFDDVDIIATGKTGIVNQNFTYTDLKSPDTSDALANKIAVVFILSGLASISCLLYTAKKDKYSRN